MVSPPIIIVFEKYMCIYMYIYGQMYRYVLLNLFFFCVYIDMVLGLATLYQKTNLRPHSFRGWSLSQLLAVVCKQKTQGSREWQRKEGMESKRNGREGKNLLSCFSSLHVNHPP